MSRLIDADKLIEDLEKVKKESTSLVDMSHIIGFQSVVDVQPTAFDVDKVVEQLKHSQYMLFEEVKNATSYYHREELIENIRHYEYAINIVKGGGIDE